ncbi:uncharacterized protein BJ171DRAFT_137168 [Polychytrium aggregatum]|uniref:uncharacterized protein n=1 Tax=Polychytrium aggregatum TaxID=110093 RepID=UPI0022FF2381|nr:uncharacterized protein BJ171DRAFT_137168 [Polychytrium aggregatum]KAI9203594.1 hypothetical protein BJ171DRAFT_137168 [Polychytrium aggregatum]
MNPGSPVMISIIETAASHLSLNAHSPAAAADGASMAVGNDATRADSLAPQDGHPPSLLKIRSAEGTSLDGQDSVSKNGNQELQPCKSDILAHEHARLHNLDRRSNLSFSDNPAGAGPTPLPSKQRVEPDTDRLILLGDLKTPPACTPSIRSLQDRGMPRTSSESESSRAGETDVSVLKRGSFNPSGSIVFRHVPGSGTDSSLVPQRLLHSPRSSIEIHTSRDSCRSEGNPQSPKISGLKRRNISLRAKPSVKSNRSSHKKENTEQSLPPQSVEINGCCDFPPELIQQVQCGMAGYFDFAEFCERLNSTCDYLDGIVKKAARRQKRLQRKGLSEACPPGENQPGLADAVDGDQQLKSSFNISEMAVSMSRSISSRRSTASKDIDISKPPAGLPWKHPAWSPLRFVKRYIKRFVRFVRRKIRNDCEEGEQQRVALLSASALLAISNIPCPPVPANCQQMDSLELALYYYHQKEPNFCVHYLEKSSQEGNPMGLFFLGMSNLPSWYDGCAAAGAAPGDAAPSWVPACGNRFRALQLFLKSVDTTLINLPSVMRWRTKGEVIFEDTSKFDGDHSRKPNRPNLIHSSSVHQELVASKSGSITSLFASGVLWTNPGLRSTLVRARCESVANNSLSRHLFGSTNMETSMSALSSFASMFSFTDQSGGRRLLKGLDDLEVAATLLPNPLYEISMILRCGGDGVPVSRAASAYFMSVAAALGDTDAQYEYGYCLIHGLGVSKNLMEAARWLRQAHAGGRRVEGEGWIFKKKWGGEE